MSDRKRIISLQASNVKRLTAVDITPNGNVVVIGGENGAGKSSVLDSIAMALSGKEIPTVPVRRGEEKASVILDLGDMVVKRTFTAKGGTALVIENKEGLRYSSPQSVLDKLTGRLMFDPVAFIKLDARTQLEQLRKLVGLDFSALDAKRKQLYDERTLTNKEADRAKAKVDFMEHHPDAPVEEVSLTDIVAERDAAKEHNSQRGALQVAVEQVEGSLLDAQHGQESISNQIAELERKLNDLREQQKEYDQVVPRFHKELRDAKVKLDAFNLIDLAPINERLVTAEQTNQQVRQNAARDAALREAQAIKAKSEALTSQIEEIDRQKHEDLAGTEFPIPLLSFDENGVTFGGLPFDQASAAQQLRASVAIAAAMNPALGVMLVRDGSLMDDKSMALLAELAGEHDVQVWVERVSSDEPGAIIIEDGTVAIAAEPTAAASE